MLDLKDAKFFYVANVKHPDNGEAFCLRAGSNEDLPPDEIMKMILSKAQQMNWPSAFLIVELHKTMDYEESCKIYDSYGLEGETKPDSPEMMDEWVKVLNKIMQGTVMARIDKKDLH